MPGPIFDVISGDFGRRSAVEIHGASSANPWIRLSRVKDAARYELNRSIAAIQIVTDETQRDDGSAARRAVAGGLLLGEAGFVAGALSGRSTKTLTFLCEFMDGKRILGQTDDATVAGLFALGARCSANPSPVAPRPDSSRSRKDRSRDC